MISNEVVLLEPGIFELHHNAWRSELMTPSVFFSYSMRNFRLLLDFGPQICYNLFIKFRGC